MLASQIRMYTIREHVVSTEGNIKGNVKHHMGNPQSAWLNDMYSTQLAMCPVKGHVVSKRRMCHSVDILSAT